MRNRRGQGRLAVGPGRFGFRHQLIRDVAYDSLPRAERARLHEDAADRIAGQAGERYPELAEVVAFHRAAACELEPAPERGDAARLATLEAAEIVSRRGASSRAQELYEHAAELAESDADRIEALRAAAEMAARRFQGDEALRLFRSAADVSERAGRDGDPASSYALAVEIATRMAGITGRLPESELRSMLDRAGRLVAPEDEVTKARLVLNEAWLAWYTERNEQMERPAREGLELARKTGDPLLISCALDAASASNWIAARHRDAVTHTRERIEVLDSVPAGTPGLGRERSDALHMMIEGLVQTASYRDALTWAARARDLDLGHGVVYSGWSRAIVPSFLLGQWDEVLQMASRVRDAWTAVDRPVGLAVMAGSVSTASAICGYRGDEGGMADWRVFAEDVARDGPQMYGIRAFLAGVRLHRGDANGAAELLDRDEPSFWWRPMFLATRAEALVLSGRPGSADALAAAEAETGDNRYAAAIILRAKAIRDADEAGLREALAIFEEIECPYQAARTGWLLGGEDRQVAQRTFERLGATLPAN